MRKLVTRNGFECNLYVNGDIRTRSAQIVQAQLADVGITVDISTYEWGAFLDTLNAGDHEMFIPRMVQHKASTQMEVPTSYSTPRTMVRPVTVHSYNR